MDLMRVQEWTFPQQLPQDIWLVRWLLQQYSHVAAEHVDNHIFHIRDKAWEISRTPFVGRWKFLNLTDPKDARYQQVLFRLKLPESTDAILDLGCCLGQALRQLHADGVNSSQIYGTDMEPRLIDVGFDLFRDRGRFNATFVTGDMIDPDDDRLDELRGKITIVHADSFFHLFNWIQQLYIGKRIVSFLKPGTVSALVYGRQVGRMPGSRSTSDLTSPFLHDEESFQQLWDEIGDLTGTRWRASLEPDGMTDKTLVDDDEGIVPVKFTIFQLP